MRKLTLERYIESQKLPHWSYVPCFGIFICCLVTNSNRKRQTKIYGTVQENQIHTNISIAYRFWISQDSSFNLVLSCHDSINRGTMVNMKEVWVHATRWQINRCVNAAVIYFFVFFLLLTLSSFHCEIKNSYLFY